MLSNGFRDALTALYGDRVTFSECTISSLDEGTHVLDSIISDGDTLIYATGNSALSACVLATSELPVVATGIMDFKDALGSHYKDTSKEYTGTNVTGISSYPDITDQLSLMIEATKDLQAVGLLYSPDDPISIRINRDMEHYLDEAGIPWKEYILPSEDYRTYLNDKAAIEAAAAKEDDPGNDGDDTSDTSVTPDATITDPSQQVIFHGLSFDEVSPRISATWTGGKGQNTTDRSSFTTDLPERASLKKVVNYACRECSVLYLPTASNLDKFASKIASIATRKQVVTVGGDMASGRYTTVTLYQDVYDIGYRAGIIAYNIITEGELPGSYTIKSAASSSYAKLYQDSVSVRFGLSFPKSFTEYDDFLVNYEPGMFTTLVS